jgi:hypothetical protein
MSTRVRIEQVHCGVDGLMTVGTVELGHGDRLASGRARARTTDSIWRQVVAEATLSAIRVFVNGRFELALDAVAEVRSGQQPLVVVTLVVGRGKNEIYASGAAPLNGDQFTAVTKAVLNGLNRWIEPCLAATATDAAGTPGLPKHLAVP